ncbi:hypothetical protein DL546_002713 [Coniochaeta pulveracea]|uniref:Pre-mRNA splicing factor CLF1 n=1 Tax=Coniochaeta pulveracea TaxID=177199 RepID=A0A420XYZ1_9PEZI|nr:hypothetical protein DL546_002713 [Coniochaeta pulveracea]
MPLPQPPVALDNVCSAIFNNTLYTYSENAFQALELIPGGNWTQLPQGEKVSGGVCVGSTPGDPRVAGFYVIGGKSANKEYQGLQKFTYAEGKWATIVPETAVTQDRLWHGATYLTASDTILMYAGAQDGSKNPSTQTFTIGASAPYTVVSYQSAAPPTINPIILPWSATQAALVGGSADNKQVFLFSPESTWIDSGASLAEPIGKDITQVQAVIVPGDDASRHLYTFDMTVSPNAVSRTVLMDGAGQPVQNSPRLVTRAEEDNDGGALTVNDWPKYNSTLAPTATRTNYGLAQDQDHMVVIAGGSKDDVLCIFDARKNVWQNATAMLEEQQVFSALATPTSSSSSSSTSTSQTSTSSSALSTTASTTAVPTIAATPTETTTPTPVAAATGKSGSNTNAILGAVFGATFGVAVILGLIYWCLMRQRARRAHLEAGHARRSSGLSSVEKDSIIYANDSMARGLSGAGTFRGHQQQNSANSFSSMAILMGKVTSRSHQQQQTPSLKRNPSDQTKRSSTSSIRNKAFKSTISKPIPQMSETVTSLGNSPRLPPSDIGDEKGVAFAADAAEPRTRTLTGGGAATEKDGETRRSSGWNKYWSGGPSLSMLGFGNGNGNSANRKSGSGLTPNSKRMTNDSDASSEYSNVSAHRITQDSATVPPLKIYEPRASFSQVNRGSPTIASYSSNIKEGMAGQIERPVSAVSSLSGYSSGIPASVHEAWDPTSMQKPWGTNRAPSSVYSKYTTYSTPLAPSRQTQNQPQLPSGVSRPPELDKPAISSDMSWLNLGN